MSIRFVALLAVAAVCCSAPASAQAGLFGFRGNACGCDVAPSCGCEVSCDPCARPSRKAKRLAKRDCCIPAPVCCTPAPVCCEATPAPCCAPVVAPAPCCAPVVAPAPCCAPAPVCCEAPVCCAPVCCEATVCCKKPGLFARLKARRAARNSCVDSCCVVVAPSCGCGIAAGCGCGH